MVTTLAHCPYPGNCCVRLGHLPAVHIARRHAVVVVGGLGEQKSCIIRCAEDARKNAQKSAHGRSSGRRVLRVESYWLDDCRGILPNADQKESTFYTERYAAHPELGDRRENVISARTYFYLNEAQCEKNTEIILNCIDAVSGATSGTGFAAVKVTALCRPHLLMQLSQIVVRMREFFRLLTGDKSYNIFQENVPRIKRQQFTDKMKELGIPITEEKCNEFFTMMDVDQNGEIGLFEWERLLKLKVKMSQYFMLPNAETGKLEPIIAPLSDDEEEAFINMMRRLNLIVERARERDVRVMIDAEQSYFQPAINRLCIEMMRKFNTDKSVIFNTYQCYLKGAYDSIKMDLDFAKRSNFYFGAKIVRGAYMEQERARAQSLGYVDPINATYEATNAMYERVVDTCMQHVRGRGFQQVAIMMATHNENTVRMAIQKMQEYGIGPQDKVICFGQLLGMCDQVSFSLGQAGYSVYKYVPYGPIEKVLPYLARRAQENKSLLKGAVKERRMLWLELKRRLRHLEISARPPLALPAAPPVSQATPTH
ncbi:PREDICTED: proline dehydrogenase 1, mitochondrial-like isoform X2 [Priapulus caudatus]|uniref:Proline dehydrogenase n=1 Tax=Priapulus caudatus TaxID=37621 RepID=A0ABM1F1W4_PRICU|nr:PREDICTED: proline dehydrogenase 1, mitochondrial-like isoform X2 [Priapulus caudatus]